MFVVGSFLIEYIIMEGAGGIKSINKNLPRNIPNAEHRQIKSVHENPQNAMSK